jgi:hypothetical protein
MARKFRLLKADEIECRVATANPQSGVSLLLYKDARADMTILDEGVGAENWQRRHTRDNANCIVSIWDDTKKQWIEKEDTGTESNTEKEKGLASDSFKRACVCWGIGRELYTAPFIWVKADAIEWTNRNGKQVPKSTFKVKDIGYDENGRISALIIVTGRGNVVYSMGGTPNPPPAKKPEPNEFAPATPEQQATIRELLTITNADVPKLLKYYGVQDVLQLNYGAAEDCITQLKKKLS